MRQTVVRPAKETPTAAPARRPAGRGPLPPFAVLQRTAGNAALQRAVVVQRMPGHVVDYLKTLLKAGDQVAHTFVTATLGLGADPSVRGWAPRAAGTLTISIAQAFVDDTTTPKEYRRKVYQLWNKDMRPADKLTLPADLQGKPLVRASTQAPGFDDSGDEAEDVKDLPSEIASAASYTIELTRPTTGTSKQVPVLPFAQAELMGRRIVKTCRRDNVTFTQFLPIAGELGGQLFEFEANMNGLDVFAYPLAPLGAVGGPGPAPPGPSLKRKASGDLAQDPTAGAPPAKWARVGNMGGHKWSDIAKGLMSEAVDPGEAKANIFSKFIGRGDPVNPTPYQSLAIAAIGCDFMKGYAASLEFVRAAVADPETSPVRLFAGTSPIYKPAGSDGRGLVVARQEEIMRSLATAPPAAPTASAPARTSASNTTFTRSASDPALVFPGSPSTPGAGGQ